MRFFILPFLLCLFIGSYAQTIGTFNSIQPTPQTQSLVLPATHTFQRIIRAGATLTSGETIGDYFDFTGYVPIAGSSTNGYLSISSENVFAGCGILSISFNPITKLWVVNSGGNVPLPFADLGLTRAFCAGTVTPNGHVMVCEEINVASDANGDGYNDDGWILEIDPVTRTVINQDGIGGPDKLWALGRHQHEDIAIVPDGSVAYWSADNAANGYIYKFVPAVPNNFSSGSLYVLKTTAALGTGTLEPVANATITDRNNTISLSAAAGAYNFNRVEGLEIGPDGKLYFPSTTSGTIYRFSDLGTTIGGLEEFVTPANFDVDGAGPFAPEPWGIGADNLAFDGEGNLWVLQDGSKNYIWVVGPGHTAAAPDVRLFATVPAGAEPTGITFSPDYKYLFLSIQHPSNSNTASQPDAAGNAVTFDTHTALVIARKENLGNTPLPVKFISFDAVQKNGAVELSWIIAPSSSHAYFEIERSADATRFERIGTDRTQKTTFGFTDKNFPAADVLYYRIKQFDNDGTNSYSAIKTIRINSADVVQLYPVPSISQLNILYTSNAAGSIKLSVVNASGAVIKQMQQAVTKGKNYIQLNTTSLKGGNYFLQIDDSTGKYTSVFLKL